MILARDMFADFDGPIPGENYTSDTKNYPWHRAPDYDDIDEAIEYMMKKIYTPEASQAILTFLEMGVTVASVVDMLVTHGIGRGKWTTDFGILLAGPLAHMICLMAKAYDIPYELGVKNTKIAPTKAFIKAMKASEEEKASKGVPSPISMLNLKGEVVSEDKPAEQQPSGFSAMAGDPTAMQAAGQEAGY